MSARRLLLPEKLIIDETKDRETQCATANSRHITMCLEDRAVIEQDVVQEVDCNK